MLFSQVPNHLSSSDSNSESGDSQEESSDSDSASSGTTESSGSDKSGKGRMAQLKAMGASTLCPNKYARFISSGCTSFRHGPFPTN